jgi:oligopeptide/dipeptide ABC transporter ATP-binding protein
VMIAMALARRPDLLIADEPTTALDVTIQDEIVKLLRRLQQQLHMAMLFVTHNVALVQQVAARTAVMYAGRIVEHGSSATVLSDPQHPYTQGLLKSLPTLSSRGVLPMLEGQPPEPAHVPNGCAFHPRCQRRIEPCDSVDPEERRAGASRTRCHLYPEA